MQGDGPESVRQVWYACHSGRHARTDYFLTGHRGAVVRVCSGVRDGANPFRGEKV